MRRALRRALGGLALVALAAGLEPTGASAQPGVRVARVSYFSPGSRGAPGHIGLRNALRELGYVEGKNLLIELRFAEGEYARLAGLAAEYAEAGGLMAYGTNLTELHRRAATYVDKIFKGARPADLPVEQPMTFDMVVNLKTAKALGLTMPPEIMVRATRVIE